MNNITVAGSLGRDAETRYLPNGDAVTSFSVADSQGRDKPTIWWNCSLFGKRGVLLSEYLKKGQAVAVSGSVSEREWQDKEGAARKSMDIRVADVALQGGKRESEPESRKPSHDGAKSRQLAPQRGTTGSGFDDMQDDSIPF